MPAGSLCHVTWYKGDSVLSWELWGAWLHPKYWYLRFPSSGSWHTNPRDQGGRLAREKAHPPGRSLLPHSCCNSLVSAASHFSPLQLQTPLRLLILEMGSGSQHFPSATLLPMSFSPQSGFPTLCLPGALPPLPGKCVFHSQLHDAFG